MIVCPACGQETPEGFPRCANCGAELGGEQAAREERKVVTVLFCDLVGSTAQAEGMDPEDVRARLSRYHEHVRSELERFGGTVEKYIGDAVMALFGAPTAHEDDPERAVRAALAIRDWAQEEGTLEVRLGITTGEALISLGARPEAGEGMASGDVVNTGARLESAASTNGILVDDTTYRATEHVFDYREADPVEAKGKSEPVPVWEPMAARALVGVELRPETPLVGRERERDRLVDALERIKREAAPQVVTLVGVPGIGKSRLVAELFVAVDEDPDIIFWRQGRSLPYGEGVAFWAFAEMVKAQAGVLNSDSTETAAEKLHEAVAAVLDADDVTWVEARLQPLLGLGERAEDRDESFAAWRRFVEALAEQRPLILVFEDLHWADDDLLDFVDYLVDWATGIPLLVVGTARPELLDRRPGWGGGKRNATTISLSPLGDVETAQLIAGLLDRPVLPAETQEELLRRAGGNPLYAEQFARMLAERGETGELPETIQGIIAARLDGLEAQEKALLQDASVVGKVFWTGALEAVSGVGGRDAERLLHGLERKEFVRRERRSSVEGETEHAFAHLLVRDVAYSQIPRRARAERHRAAAEWMESLGRTEDRAELLAYHYLSALELSQAAGIDTAPIEKAARDALVDAGDRAGSLNSFASSDHFYRAALELTPDEDATRPYIILRAARHTWGPGSRWADRETFASAISGFLAVGDSEAAAEAKMLLAGAIWNEGDSAGAAAEIREAVELLAEEPPSRVKVMVLSDQARYAMLSRHDDDAIRLAREGLELAEQLGLESLRATLLNTIGTCRVDEGDLGGFDDLEKALAIAQEIVDPGEIHRAYNNLGEAHRNRGSWEKAARLAAEMRNVDERYGLLAALHWVEGEEATVAYYRGEWDRAIESANRVIAEVAAGSPNYMEPVCQDIRAKIRFARGDEAGALDDSTKSVEAGRGSDPQVLGVALATRGLFSLARGDHGAASKLASEALSIPAYFYAAPGLATLLHDLKRSDELVPWVKDLRGSPWAEVALAIGKGGFHEAAEIFEPTGNVAEEAHCRLRSGTDADVRKALDFYRSVGATRYIREGEALLAASA